MTGPSETGTQKPGENELLMAERHVHQGEVHVERQKQIIAELRADGHPTLQAESLLKSFEDTLDAHRADLARLRVEAER